VELHVFSLVCVRLILIARAVPSGKLNDSGIVLQLRVCI
jgi:hypothetical protein